jgi:hypothetical protein
VFFRSALTRAAIQGPRRPSITWYESTSRLCASGIKPELESRTQVISAHQTEATVFAPRSVYTSADWTEKQIATNSALHSFSQRQCSLVQCDRVDASSMSEHEESLGRLEQPTTLFCFPCSCKSSDSCTPAKLNVDFVLLSYTNSQ